jgi:hypothetical protein
MTDVRLTEEFVALGHAGSEHYAGLETTAKASATSSMYRRANGQPSQASI